MNQIDLISLPSRLKCYNCNLLISDEWIYCEHCGKQLQQIKKKQKEEKEEKENKEEEKNYFKNIKVNNLLKLQQFNLNYKIKNKNEKNKKNKKNFNEKEVKQKKNFKEIEKKNKLKELNYIKNEDNILKYEQRNKKLLKLFYKIEKLNQNELENNFLLNEKTLSTYLDEQPSIIDRLNEGFTPEEDAEIVLFWGQQQQDKDEDEDENEDENEDKHKKKKDKNNSNSTSLFTSSFWGNIHQSDNDDKNYNNNNLNQINYGENFSFNETDEYEEENENDDKNNKNDKENKEKDNNIDTNPENERINTSNTNNTHLSTNESSITIFDLETIRRKISTNLLSVVQQMKWILKSIVIDVTKDPINFPKPLRKYQTKINQLYAAINRTYEVEIEVEKMSQEYVQYADVLRRNVAVKVMKTQKRSEKLHQQCHQLYELISSGVYLNSNYEIDENYDLITDSYLIQKNQERVLEYSQKLLQPIKKEIHSNLLEENQLIAMLK